MLGAINSTTSEANNYDLDFIMSMSMSMFMSMSFAKFGLPSEKIMGAKVASLINKNLSNMGAASRLVGSFASSEAIRFFHSSVYLFASLEGELTVKEKKDVGAIDNEEIELKERIDNLRELSEEEITEKNKELIKRLEDIREKKIEIGTCFARN